MTLANDCLYDCILDTPKNLLNQSIRFVDHPTTLLNVSEHYFADSSEQFRELISSTVVPSSGVVPDVSKLKCINLDSDEEYNIIRMSTTEIEAYVREVNDILGIFDHSDDIQEEREKIGLTLYIRQDNNVIYTGYGYKIGKYLYILDEEDVTSDFKSNILPEFFLGDMGFKLPRLSKGDSRVMLPRFNNLLHLNTKPVGGLMGGNISIGIDDGESEPYYLIEYANGSIILNRLITKHQPEQTKYITNHLTDGSDILRYRYAIRYDVVRVDGEEHKYRADLVKVFDFNNSKATICYGANIKMGDTTFYLDLERNTPDSELKRRIENYVRKHNQSQQQ